MIEFKGTYFQPSRNAPITVLVQFDGTLLHVWHLSDPFHRLFTSEQFYIIQSHGQAQAQHGIKLPNGGLLETDDIQTFKLFASQYQNAPNKNIKTLDANNLLLALLGFAAIILGAWWILSN